MPRLFAFWRNRDHLSVRHLTAHHTYTSWVDVSISIISASYSRCERKGVNKSYDVRACRMIVFTCYQTYDGQMIRSRNDDDLAYDREHGQEEPDRQR